MVMLRASSSLRSGMTSRLRSSRPWWAKRKPPAVKKELPPRSGSGAFSSTSTEAPPSRAASAAQRAALPPPITTTSCAIASTTSSPAGSAEPGQQDETESHPVPAERDEAVRLDPSEQPPHRHEGGHRGHHGAQREEPPVGRRARGMAKGLQRLEPTRREEGGHPDQERELGRDGPAQAEQHDDQDGGGRARPPSPSSRSRPTAANGATIPPQGSPRHRSAWPRRSAPSPSAGRSRAA